MQKETSPVAWNRKHSGHSGRKGSNGVRVPARMQDPLPKGLYSGQRSRGWRVWGAGLLGSLSVQRDTCRQKPLSEGFRRPGIWQ